MIGRIIEEPYWGTIKMCIRDRVGAYNAQYAKEHFMASSVARQIENTIKETIRL